MNQSVKKIGGARFQSRASQLQKPRRHFHLTITFDFNVVQQKTTIEGGGCYQGTHLLQLPRTVSQRTS